MNEQLVSFKVAKLAKEIRFDWKCRYAYHYDNGNNFTFDFTEEEFINNFHKNKDADKDYISAPIQSLLQKWLRDIHGIAVHISTDITLSWVYTIQSLHPQATYTGSTIASVEVFSTYEEALEKGLYRALKLIKDEN